MNLLSIETLSKCLSIILLNLVLSGDNAVVIALATRKLDPAKGQKAILIGTAGAVVLRILLMLIAIQLLTVPFVKVVGSLLLLYIAYDLLKSNNEEESDSVKSQTTFLSAIRTIILADLVMSLDNVLAIAGVAEGHFGLAIFGLVVSIPIVVFCSQLIVKLMDRFPLLIWIGALLIAYTAGTMIVEDKYAAHALNALVPHISHTHVIPILFGVILIVVHLILDRLTKKQQAA